jgi:hypothetical protein
MQKLLTRVDAWGRPSVRSPDGAFSMAARLYVASYAVWSDPANDVANAVWHRSVTDALAPFATGYYAGESDVIAMRRAPGAASRRRRGQGLPTCAGSTTRPVCSAPSWSGEEGLSAA